MAGDWIKMRAALMSAPKLIALARHLHRCQDFRDWLTPGGGGPMNGQIVSDDALRCVTCALLLRVWSASREFGKFDGDNLVLPHLSIPDLDQMAGAPSVGKAMLAVGWATLQDGDHDGVVLPNFRQHNAPMTPAEKQSQYRKRQKPQSDDAPKGGAGALPSVTGALPSNGNKTVTREEKRREEENPPTPLAAKAAEVAQRFWFSQKGRKEEERTIADLIEEMLRVGYLLEDIAREVDHQKRDRGERFWKLKDRLEKMRPQPAATIDINDQEAVERLVAAEKARIQKVTE